MSYATIERRDDHVAILRMDREARLNALGVELVTDVVAALNELEADSEVRAVVLAGAGRAFSSGGDLADVGARVAGGEPEARIEVMGALHHLITGLRNSRLGEAIRIIEQHIESPLSSSELALRLGVSTRQLERMFERYMNTSPKRYIMDLRLHRARNLIVQSDQALTEIAMACGFTSTSHFSKVYRDHFGNTPGSQRSVLN